MVAPLIWDEVMSSSHRSNLLQRIFYPNNRGTRKDAKPAKDTEWKQGDVVLIPKFPQCPVTSPLGRKLRPRTETCATLLKDGVPLSPCLSVKSSLGRSLSHADSTTRHGRRLASEERSQGDMVALMRHNQLQHLATKISSSPTVLSEWFHYLQHYANGQFNISRPPKPPPAHPSFTYLRAPLPLDEVQRLHALQPILASSGNTSSGNQLQVALTQMCRQTMSLYSVKCSVISLFDTKQEMVLAECGYGRGLYPREHSIAAHALLTEDVMTIIDTAQDWRFANNPLVSDLPQLRFFASAPLMTATGQAVGTISIFHPQAPSAFGATEKRSLCEIAENIMLLLTQRMDEAAEDSVEDERATPLLDRREFIYGPAPARLSPEASATPRRKIGDRSDRQLVPQALRIEKQVSKSGLSPSLTLNTTDLDTTTAQRLDTPPYDDVSDYEHRRDLMMHQKLQNTALNKLEDPFVTTPESPIDDGKRKVIHFPEHLGISHRGASVSKGQQDDISPVERKASYSLTKATTVMSDPLPRNPYVATSESGLALPVPESPVLPRKDLGRATPSAPNRPLPRVHATTPHSQPNPSGISSKNRSKAKNSPRSANRIKNRETMVLSTCSLSITDMFPDDDLNAFIVPYEGPDTEDSYLSEVDTSCVTECAEARFAMEFWAPLLHFDGLYVVELQAAIPFLADEDLIQGGLKTRIVASFGIPTIHTSLDLDLHLAALRTAEPTICTATSDHIQMSSRSTILVPIPHDKLRLPNRSNGLLFGAYRHDSGDGTRPTTFTEQEIGRIQELVKTLRTILFKPARKNMRLTRSEPASPRPFPAGEAVEVDFGKHSLDAGHFRTATLERRER